MKIAPWVYALGILLLGMLYARACWEPSIRADERQRAGDRGTDSVVSRLTYEARTAETRLVRERDSTGRVIRDLKRRAAPQTSPVATASGGLSPAVVSAHDVRDSLIAALVAGRAQDSLQILFWKAQVAQRDSLIPVLQRSRDSWRRAASKPSHTVTDIGGGAIAGWGLAEKCSECVLAGAAVVVVPRMFEVVGRAVKRIL